MTSSKTWVVFHENNAKERSNFNGNQRISRLRTDKQESSSPADLKMHFAYFFLSLDDFLPIEKLREVKIFRVGQPETEGGR